MNGHMNAVIDILRQSRPVSIYVRYEVNSQQNAMMLWQFLMGMFHVCPNTIEWFYCDMLESEFTDVNWDFILSFVYTYKIQKIENVLIMLGAEDFTLRGALYPRVSNFTCDDLTEKDIFNFVYQFHGMWEEVNINFLLN